MLLNRVCCSTTSVIVSKREFKFCFFRSCSKARKLIYANYLISRVHFAFRFARTSFARNSGERGGRGGGEGGRQEINKIYFFYHFWFIYQLIYLLPYLRVIFSVVKANMEEMVKALYLLLKTFLFFPKKLYLKIEVVLERTKMEKFPV